MLLRILPRPHQLARLGLDLMVLGTTAWPEPDPGEIGESQDRRAGLSPAEPVAMGRAELAILMQCCEVVGPAQMVPDRIESVL
ncbi:hypothetical protein [Bosea sp. PAMC 26642]|uniref:hypothetical protein n=1 Tax=Bosea sp. (strain PAMC 26642) TaxID=1792307 RepID=UPI0007700536|nr:hypothetical protein [Bosea sp. PAMC 26642]AMJ63028.1 hypothetical protein AXW83_24455 [Bosea sp. PAMC 26642]